MRIWSIHPHYLDSKGLVALWREGLLALHVLSGKTKGYTKHPQLQRFQNHTSPIESMSTYLHGVVDEAEARGYAFNRQKLPSLQEVKKITITSGQIAYETHHLTEKLRVRDPNKLLMLEKELVILPHPLFEVTDGPIESWEKTITLDHFPE